jgi:hypothetical protein
METVRPTPRRELNGLLASCPIFVSFLISERGKHHDTVTNNLEPAGKVDAECLEAGNHVFNESQV